LRFSLIQELDVTVPGSLKSAGHTDPAGDSVKVLYLIEKSGYIWMERSKVLLTGINNVNHFGLVEEGKKSSASIDSTGGTLIVANIRGDSITLEIPPYAIWEPTMITLTTMDTPPDNPVAGNIFPGVSITPGGLTLLQPAVLKVDLASATPDTGSAALFSVRQSDFILPIGHQAIAERQIAGEIYHFSDYIGGEPTADEAGPQAGQAGGMKPSDPYGWEDTYDCIEALLWWAEFYNRNGRLEEAQECYDRAEEIADRDARDFLNLPIPDDPCKEYLTALLKYAGLVNLLVGGELESQVQDRVIEVVNKCNLRGEIEYDHHIICTDPDRYTETKIKGRIPFYVNTVKEPYNTVHGGGEAKLTITGAQEECWLTASGTHRVDSIAGELKADYQGIYWLEMTLYETWWESTTIYVNCPDPENSGSEQMYSFSFPTQVRFLVEDGYKHTMPDFECAGSYQWILHIIHQP
jgi:tetratricopeptide (TPR) repeat protein